MVRDSGAAALNTSQLRSQQAQVRCNIGTGGNAGTCEEHFLEVSARLEAKTYFILLSPLKRERQPVKICWLERPASGEWWEKC